jgi:uncharacterized protein with HEPN domain
MKRDYKLFINDIKESLGKVEEYLNGITEEQFVKDGKLQDAVIRRIEIMGEASKNIPRSLKEKNKHVSWVSLSQFRDFITHSYYEASLNRIWKVCKEDLPKIKESLKDIELV